jgi:hypothetical protein
MEAPPLTPEAILIKTKNAAKIRRGQMIRRRLYFSLLIDCAGTIYEITKISEESLVEPKNEKASKPINHPP